MKQKEIYQSWLKAVKTHDFEETERLYAEILREFPDLSGVHYPMGVWYKEKNLNQKAYDALIRALKTDPDIMADTYYYLGNVLRNMGDYKEAVFYYTKSLEKDPEFFEAQYNLGKVYSMMGENNRALEEYKKALKLNKQDLDTYVNIGVEFSNLGLHQEALEMYQLALAIDPHSSLVYSNIGVEYALLGQYEQAINYHKNAIKLNSFYGDAWYNLGCSYALNNNQVDAIKALEKAFKIDKENIFYAKNDPELESIRSTPEFKKLIELSL
ncbi:MAG: tetratricopeptide repeat protein [Bacillota bacterium]